MNRSDRDPDAIDRIRDDALTTEAARIAELEAQLAAAQERERAARETLRRLQCSVCSYEQEHPYGDTTVTEDVVWYRSECACARAEGSIAQVALRMQDDIAALAAAQPASDGGEDWVDYDENSEENEGNG